MPKIGFEKKTDENNKTVKLETQAANGMVRMLVNNMEIVIIVAEQYGNGKNSSRSLWKWLHNVWKW